MVIILCVSHVLRLKYIINDKVTNRYSIAVTKKFNEERFLTDLSESLNSVNLSNSDSDHNFKTWTTSFISVFNNHAPLKTKRVKHETQSDWINGDLKSAMKNRDTNHELKNWYQYKYWRNKTISLIKSSKKHFFARSIDDTF